MADVRGASGIPGTGVFAGIVASTPSTPLYIDTDNGDLYALIGGAVKKLTSASIAGGLTATGTNQATALPMTAFLNVLTTVAADTGALLSATQNAQVVYNGGANPLRVYPVSGAKINSLATNAFMLLAINTACIFWYVSATQWIGVLSA